MKSSTLVLALASAVAVDAHTIFTTLWVDGVSAGDGVGIRMRKDPETASFPISIGNDAMACGYDGESGNPRVVSVHDAATLSFEWRATGNDPSKGAIDPGHKGPCAVYLKKVDSAINDSAVGDGWFKIWDEGYDESTNQWCNEKLGGADSYGVYQHKLSVNLPSGLEGGYYLARPEILALHAAVANPPDPQFYTGCAQIFLESHGTKGPDETVSIPGYVKSSDASVTFDVYEDPLALPYDTPGPPVAALVSGASGSVGQTAQTEGLQPAGCILEMAGWCGYEVASYTDETGCWAAAQDCWNQDTACWTYSKEKPTSGLPWCNLWEDKCQGIDDQCNAGNFVGPPNKGKDLTPALSSTTVVLGAWTSNYESSTSAAVDNAAATASSAEAATSAASTTTLLTMASSVVESVAPVSTSESSSTATSAATTAAPSHNHHWAGTYASVQTVYETVVVTQVEYKTVGAKHRRRAEHLADHGVQPS